MEREFDAYKLSRSMYPSICNSIPAIRTASAKNRRFHVLQPTFLFPLETPLRLSRNILHYRDLEMWVRGHSRSLKLVPFKSMGVVSYSPSIVTVAVSVAVCEIFSVREWCDLENRVRVRSRSLIMTRFDRPCMTIHRIYRSHQRRYR